MSPSPAEMPLPETPRAKAPRRIVVLGTSGSGKTTLAGAISRRLGIPHVELDALFWGPNWTNLGGSPENDTKFRARVAEATAGDAWVVDGNYAVTHDVTWPRAELFVWLDLPLPVVFWSVLQRTLRRAATRELLWGTNRESFRMSFLSRDSLLLWVLTTHRSRRKRLTALLLRPEMAHVTVVRLRSRRAVHAWLESLTAQSAVQCPESRVSRRVD